MTGAKATTVEKKRQQTNVSLLSSFLLRAQAEPNALKKALKQFFQIN
jgi:hypothetical protein